VRLDLREIARLPSSDGPSRVISRALTRRVSAQ
jgi:hypothetical protein